MTKMEAGGVTDTATLPLLLDAHASINDGSSEATTFTLVLSTFVASCGYFSMGSIAGYSSPAESGIKEDLGLSTAEFAVFASILTVGGMIGAIICGKAADILGRKGAMWVADVFICIGWLSIAFATNAFWLDLGRLSGGIGFCLTSYVVRVYIAEITPKNLRGLYSSCTGIPYSLGFLLIYFLGTMITWRHLALVGCSGGCVRIIGLFFIPESPRWLAKIGSKELETSLQRLRGGKADVSHEATEIRDYTETFEKFSKSSIFTLFQRRYAHAVIVGVGLMVLQQLAGINAISSYASNIFDSAGYSTTVGSLGVAFIQIPFTLLGIFLVDISGRRALLMVSAGGMFLGSLVAGISFLLQDYEIYTEITPVMVFIGLLLYTAACIVGVNGIPWLILSEIFPVNLKASAGPLVALSNWTCCLAITYSFSFLFDWSSAGVFFFFAAVSGLTVLFVAKVVPETKMRQIEEIQASLNHFT